MQAYAASSNSGSDIDKLPKAAQAPPEEQWGQSCGFIYASPATFTTAMALPFQAVTAQLLTATTGSF